MRSRQWLVESVEEPGGSPVVSLACADDDAQGQALEVFWDCELDRRILHDEGWNALGERGFDDPRRFAGFFHTLRWNCVTATDPRLIQSPFRAGIRLDAYQMEPLRKALRLPRVNLFIADDTGLGKTVEAGFGVNLWRTHSRFLVSHRLLADPTYTDPIREGLGPLSPGSLLILDEAHHAAPSPGGRYGIETKFTRAVHDLAGRFEHRLFLSATPHNGHSNSFATLLELLDPYRFTRGVKVRGRLPGRPALRPQLPRPATRRPPMASPGPLQRNRGGRPASSPAGSPGARRLHGRRRVCAAGRRRRCGLAKAASGLEASAPACRRAREMAGDPQYRPRVPGRSLRPAAHPFPPSDTLFGDTLRLPHQRNPGARLRRLRHRRFGILLYTGSPDAEGTLGGLVQQARSIEDHLEHARKTGALCSNDPVCGPRPRRARARPPRRGLLRARRRLTTERVDPRASPGSLPCPRGRDRPESHSFPEVTCKKNRVAGCAVF